jgi:HK97 family phage prohead protease
MPKVQLKKLLKPVKFEASLHIEKIQEVPESDQSNAEIKRIVEGYAIVAGNVDEQRDRIEPSALAKAVEYLKSYTTVLFNHDPNRPIGKILDIAVREAKIWVKVLISNSEDEIWGKVVEKIINSFSISGEIDEFAYEYDKALQSQVRVIKSFRVYEISLVSVPANSEAKTFNAYISKSLQDAGYSFESTNEDQSNVSEMLEFLNIGMEVVKAMDWKEKLTKAIKALGDVAAKIEDAQVRDTLKEIQKLLTDVAAEVPQNYPAANKDLQDALDKIKGLEGKIGSVEKTLADRLEKVEKDLGSVDEILGGMTEMLKSSGETDAAAAAKAAAAAAKGTHISAD